jgi:hypothetical protein
MQAADDAVHESGYSGELPAEAAIETQLTQILNADRNAVFAVVNDAGVTIGSLTRQVVVDLLAAAPRKS